MKKRILCVLMLVLTAVIITSCAGNKSLKTAKQYLDEYYQNFSDRNSSQCYYQLNKNSSDILTQKYNIGIEDLISARSRVLGAVLDYEITSENYFKEGTDEFVDLEVLVKYKNAEVNEKYQIVIKKDGQTSINILEFADDGIIAGFINDYKNLLIMSDLDALSKLASEQYLETKTERNFKSMVEQANTLGGKLWGCEIIEENYYYQSLNIGSYVYEALLEMKYENTVMQNKIKITENNGKLGIGYTMILPEKVLSFYENYTLSLKDEDKETILSMYNPELYGGDVDRENKEWDKLMSYSQTYGELLDYEILSIGTEEIQMPDGSVLESVATEALLNYKNKEVKHKITLIENSNGDYIIFEQHISND